MSKIIFGGFIGFMLATAVFVVTVRIYTAGKMSIIQPCYDNGYFVHNNSLYECKKAVSNG